MKLDQRLIISIDPGDRYVGIFVRYPFGYEVIQLDTIKNRPPDINTKNQLVELYLNSILNMYVTRFYDILHNQPILIVEDYVNYMHKSHIKGGKTNETSEMIGFLKEFAREHHMELVMQRAVQAKAWTNERLERLGILTTKGNTMYFLTGEVIYRHTRDALRHFIYYTNKNYFDNAISKTKLEIFVADKV